MSDPIPLAEEMSDNIALRHLVALTDLMLGELNQNYIGIDGQENMVIVDTLTTLRAEDVTAKKTVVINLGEAAFRLYEAGELVSYLEPLQTWVSPLTGKGALTGQCAEGESTTASVTTYLTIATEPVEVPEGGEAVLSLNGMDGNLNLQGVNGISITSAAGGLQVGLSQGVINQQPIYPSIEGALGLETIPTVGLSDRLYWVRESGFTRGWRLSAGTQPNDLSSGVWRPLDYNATTNAKNFTREI